MNIKILALLTISISSFTPAVLASDYREKDFAAMTAHYWCVFKKRPYTIEDIASVHGSLVGKDPELLKELQSFLNKVTVSGNKQGATTTYIPQEYIKHALGPSKISWGETCYR